MASLTEILYAIRLSNDSSRFEDAFHPMSGKLAELICLYFYLISQFKESVALVNDEPVIAENIRMITDSMECNLKSLIEMLQNFTNRSITIHRIQKKDTLWKVAKEYGSDLREIFVLNNMKNIFSLDGKQVLLVPSNISESIHN